MSHFRIYHHLLGSHVHMRVYASLHATTTHGKCGDLTMTYQEFNDFHAALQVINKTVSPGIAQVEFLQESEAPSYDTES